MAQYDYQGVDKNGRTVRGTTTAGSKEDVKAQLKDFGFREIRVTAKVSTPKPVEQPGSPEEQLGDDYVQRLVDGDLGIHDAVDEEEAAEDEWRRLEVMQRVRRYRHKENVAIVITLIVVGALASHFIFDWMTTITAPQPRIITRSDSEMLSFQDLYVKDDTLFFIIHAQNWNGNVRVDFKAWDPFGKVADFRTARLGFIGDHYGGSPEKSGTFRLKKTRFYDTIEVRVSGDEDK
jgi:hypothetical protein